MFTERFMQMTSPKGKVVSADIIDLCYTHCIILYIYFPFLGLLLLSIRGIFFIYFTLYRLLSQLGVSGSKTAEQVSSGQSQQPQCGATQFDEASHEGRVLTTFWGSFPPPHPAAVGSVTCAGLQYIIYT